MQLVRSFPKKGKIAQRMQFAFCVLLLAAAMVFSLLGATPAPADDGPLRNDSRKWRIASYEGGPWPDYKDSVLATVQALMDRGWIAPAPIPDFPDPANMTPVWQWLANDVSSKYLEFPEDAFYSAGWQEERRAANREALLDRLADNEFDLVLALGTWAGLDLANDLHKTPTIVMSTSNPVTAGIIPSATDSGRDHVHVRTDPTRVYRQVLLFHDIFAFERLGVIYEDTPIGRSYAYLPEVRDACTKRGVEIVTCHAPNTGDSIPEEELLETYVRCARELAPAVDAFLYDDHYGAAPDSLARSLPIFVNHAIPTWTTRGRELVEQGVLMSIARKDFSDHGQFYAAVMARIFHGAKPGDLNQVSASSFRLAVNLETARRIGFEPPPNLLRVADDVFENAPALTEPPRAD